MLLLTLRLRPPAFLAFVRAEAYAKVCCDRSRISLTYVQEQGR